MPTESVIWSVLYSAPSNEGTAPQPLAALHYVPVGDSLLNGEVYELLYVSGGAGYDPATARYVGAYRSEGAEVWWWPAEAPEPQLLFDLAVEVGDTLQQTIGCSADSTNCPWLTVEQIDTVQWDDEQARRRFFVYHTNTDYAEYAFSWIEGVGATFGPVPDWECLRLRYFDEYPACDYTLLCHQQKEQLLYTEPMIYEGSCHLEETPIGNTVDLERAPTFELSPNPAHSTLNVKMLGVNALTVQPYQIYAATGALVASGEFKGAQNQVPTHQLPPGVYAIMLPRNGSVSVSRFMKI